LRLSHREVLLCKPIRGSLGSPQRRALSPVSKPGFLDSSRPAVCSSSVTITSSSFLDVSPLQSSFVHAPRPKPFDFELHLPRFSSRFRDITTAQPLIARLPTSRYGPSSAFAAARRFHPRIRLRAYFIPLPRPGFILFRGLLSPRSHPSSSKGRSPLPLLHRRSLAHFHSRRSERAATCDASRLRGFDPRKAAFHELGYSPRPQPLPSSVSLSSRFLPLSTSAPAYPAPSALGVLRVDQPAHLQRLVIESLRLIPSPERPDLLEFSSLPIRNNVRAEPDFARRSRAGTRAFARIPVANQLVTAVSSASR
jgi:hypothetical protein